jgi:hypothetical protein
MSTIGSGIKASLAEAKLILGEANQRSLSSQLWAGRDTRITRCGANSIYFMIFLRLSY